MKLLHTCLAVLLMALCTGPVAVAQTTTMDYSYYDGTTDLAQTGSGKKETYDWPYTSISRLSRAPPSRG